MIKNSPIVNLLVEGLTDEVVIRRILLFSGLTCGTVYGGNGKADLLQRLPNYNQAARFSTWLAVVDLDQSAGCAPQFIQRLLPFRSNKMYLRVAVRAIESWILADSEHLAAFLSVSPSKIPVNPDEEENPKQTLVNLARESRIKTVREDMVPRLGSRSRIGPGYTGKLIEFVTLREEGWRPDVAAQRSNSLRKCLAALKALKDETVK